MLVEFEVGNFLSFRETMRLSMVKAAPFHEYEAENVFQAQRFQLLKSAAMYGANASGKTNLLAAMSFMKRLVLKSAKETQSVETIEVTPFKFDVATENAPSHFQIVFVQNEMRYRYGFEVDSRTVRAEWLYCAEAGKERLLFLRKDDGIEVTRLFKEGKGLEARTRDNALFLSVVDQLNGPTAHLLLECFDSIRFLYGLRDEKYQKYTEKMLQDEKMHVIILDMIHSADLGIEDIKIEKDEVAEKETKYSGLYTVHPMFENGLRVGSANLDFYWESEGTKKYFRMAGPIFDCLLNGYVVAIDELDAKLHPILTRAVVRLFHNPEINTKNAQLIFGTHDTNLLHHGKFRRDQIWFTEKNEEGATDLYSLAEIRMPKGKIRKDASFEKDYIQGRYGAVPYLGDFSLLHHKEGENG